MEYIIEVSKFKTNLQIFFTETEVKIIIMKESMNIILLIISELLIKYYNFFSTNLIV